MAYTLQEIIDRAISIAARGSEPSLAVSLSTEMVTEDLLVHTFAQVADRIAGSARRYMLRRPLTLTFANGVSTLPETVLTPYLCESTLYDPADLTALYSWEPEWQDFVRCYDQRIGYYCVNESDIVVVQPAAAYTVGAGLSGDLTLTTPSAVAVPTAAADPVVARDEVVEEIIWELGEALRLPTPRFRQVGR